MIDLKKTNRYWLYIHCPYEREVICRRCTVKEIIIAKLDSAEIDTIIYTDDESPHSGIISMPLDWIIKTQTLIDLNSVILSDDIILEINSFL